MEGDGNDMKLEVLISTIGEEGIGSVASKKLPQVDGVGYLISWQIPGGESFPDVPKQLIRPDIRIVTHDSRGICRNRNHAFRHAKAPLLLVSDDDVDFKTQGLENLIEMAETRPHTDIFLCRYRHKGNYLKPYPDTVCGLREAPKGYYVSAIEIAIRKESVERLQLRFNEKISLGTPYLRNGEEDVFIYDALKAGANVEIVPIDIANHDGEATAQRASDTDNFIMTHGAIIKYIHPCSWPLRLLVHASRTPKPFRYLKLAFQGIVAAKKHNLFN